MLYLLPNDLNLQTDTKELFPPLLADVVVQLDGLIAESEKEGRRFLKKWHPDFRSIPIRLLNEHTQTLDMLIDPLIAGETWGLISDCGLPVIADPGANLIQKAKEHDIIIKTLPGPSSLIYLLQLSGISSQKFFFHGYPYRKEPELKEYLRLLEKNCAHLFIEAPYRTERLLQFFIQHLKDDTMLSVGIELGGHNEKVWTQKIKNWKKNQPVLGKTPAIFLIYIKKQ